MAAAAVLPPPRQKWSLNSLSSELLVLVFEHVLLLDGKALTDVRRVCRRFDALATPIAYRTVVLNEEIVGENAEARWRRAFRHICAHTNHVITTSTLDPQGSRRIFSQIRKLESVRCARGHHSLPLFEPWKMDEAAERRLANLNCLLRWRYVEGEFCSGSFWMPSDLLSNEVTSRDQTRLYVEELPLRHFEGDASETYLKAIPADLLVSLRMAHPTPPLTTRLACLKRLLLHSHRLETLCYQDRGQGTSFAFSGQERLPAVKELSLKCYDWNHDRTAVQRHWDFSRIRTLDLISVPIFNFLSSVSFPDFSELRRVHMEDYSAHLLDRRREATQMLYTLVKRHIRALEDLRLTCHIRLFPIDAVLAHAPTLRVLSLRDHVGFSEERHRCPTLAVDDLMALARSAVYLHTLELDMDTALTDVSAFLNAVCAFPALHTLTLHVQTVLDVHQRVDPDSDPDWEAAINTFGFLLKSKVPGRGDGAAAVPWRSITINVGGWRPVMIRRLSNSWVRMNEVGLFAERCFVLERGADGGLAVREEDGGVENIEHS